MDVVQHSRRKSLDPNERDWLITNVILNEANKEIINFTALQIYEDRQDKPHPIILHDFSHGAYNIHKYFLSENTRKEMRHEPLRNELFYLAKKDILQNWKYYRNEFLRRYLPYELQV